MKKAIYKPTKQNIIILEEIGEYCEVLLDGDYKTIPKSEIEFFDTELSSLKEIKESIFINCIKNPLSDILYSYNSNRLTPESHQYKPLIKFLNSENNRILIADEVGLGKTIEAGMIYKEIDKREELKISLVVVPSSLTYKWKEEMKLRFDEDFEIYKTNQFLHFIDEVENYSDSKLFNEKIIISYHTLRDERVMKRLKNSFFEVDFLIMDEAHTMRNFETSTFESAEILTSLSENIIFLSATPIQNSLTDLFNILSLLDKDYFSDFDYFRKMLKPNPIIHKTISMIRNNTPLNEIQTFIKNNYLELKVFDEILSLKSFDTSKKVELIDKLTKEDHLSFIINRTKKKDVGLSTTRKAKSIVVEITQEEKEYYNAVIDFVKFLNPQVPQGFITIMPERMASSSMIASLESFKEIKKTQKFFIKDIDELEEYYQVDIKKEAIKYLDNIIEKGDLIKEDSKFLKFEEILKDLHSKNIKQMIVFSFFKKTIDYLDKKLKSLGYKVGKIHGDFSIEERFEIIQNFRNNKFDILLSSEVGSEGLDMQFCNVVINYDLPWNPMRVEQRIGRIDRIGQKFDKLYIFNLAISGSIEDRILSRLYNKLNIFENSIGELEPILGDMEKELNISELMNLSPEEIDKILSQKELALERKKQEISTQLNEFDKLLNEFNYNSSLLNHLKLETLQNQAKDILIQFLDENSINYNQLKNETIKLSSENIKKFFELLRKRMSDKRNEPLKYKEERKVLQKIRKNKELKLTFKPNGDYNSLYIYLNHSIISLIIKDKTSKITYSIFSNPNYQGYAITYRVDFQSLKNKSFIKTIILDENFNFITQKDYFEFINECKESNTKKEIDFEKLKKISTNEIIKNIQNEIKIEEENQNRLIEIKIESINNYFAKKIKKLQNLLNKIEQEDIKKMRLSQIENLTIQHNKKIEELQNQKIIKHQFKILNLGGIER